MNSRLDHRFRLWDGPTRLFHWLLVVSVAAAILTGQIGGNWIDWHGRLGLLILGLIMFRLLWGVVGSTYARWCQFWPTPAKIRAYLRGEWEGVGHNPLGALSVIGLVGLLLWQAGSGLFANDDIAFSGPLADRVTQLWSHRLTGWHQWTAGLLMGLIALHIGAIAFYSRFKRQNLLLPMITGWQRGDPQLSASGGRWWGLLLALGVAVLVVVAVSGVFPSSEAPAPAVETPAW